MYAPPRRGAAVRRTVWPYLGVSLGGGADSVRTAGAEPSAGTAPVVAASGAVSRAFGSRGSVVSGMAAPTSEPCGAVPVGRSQAARRIAAAAAKARKYLMARPFVRMSQLERARPANRSAGVGATSKARLHPIGVGRAAARAGAP